MAPLEMFPIPKRDTYRTDSYLVLSSSYRSSYRSICRLVVLLIGMQLLTLAVLIAAVVR